MWAAEEYSVQMLGAYHTGLNISMFQANPSNLSFNSESDVLL
jgi:hypothetical protein